VRDHSRRLPEMRRTPVTVEEIPNSQSRTLRRHGHPYQSPRVDQLEPSALSDPGVAVHREGALQAAAMRGVEADDHADLPHPGGPLPERPGAAR
jgi:hypothetical protein